MNHTTTRIFALLLCALAALTAQAQPEPGDIDYHLDAAWGEPPGGDWAGNTSWITTDGKGLVYVLVRTPPYVRVFKRDGSFVKSWGGDIPMASAHSITIDDDGNAWITDSAGHVVRKFTNDGELLMTLGEEGVPGDNDSRDHFNQPNHVAIAANGDIYITDGYGNARVVHLSPTGKFIRAIGNGPGSGDGQFKVPHGLALDSRGRVLVNDSENFRVNVYDKNGKFVETWPYPSRGGIEVMPDDTVYISDVNEGVVSMVRDGKLLGTMHAPRAHGLGVDSNGDIYVSGASRGTVMKITR